MNPTLFNQKKINESRDILRDSLRVEINGLTDYQGYQLSEREFNEYYQYREFFTKTAETEKHGITSNLVDKSKPVIQNTIFGPNRGDTAWLNTPLISENMSSRTLYSDNEKINRYIESMYEDNGKNLNEIIYLHTDREMYAPEDTLWFKAYIRNKAFLTPSPLSKTFFLQLVGRDGEIIAEDTWLVMDSEVHGQINLDHTLSEGTYYLTGYSSWMKNFGNEAMFIKKILIRKDRRDGYQLIASYDKESYFPGDTMMVRFHCYDELDRETEGVSFSYRFVAGEQVIHSGRSHTPTSRLEPVSVVVPLQLPGTAELMIRSDFMGQNLDATYFLPINKDIHVGFFPEGGQCIQDHKSIMAFKAVTKNGTPVDIEGNIIDQDGNLLSTIKSQYDGMGSFEYNPEKDVSAFLHLTRPAGMDRTYPLPVY